MMINSVDPPPRKRWSGTTLPHRQEAVAGTDEEDTVVTITEADWAKPLATPQTHFTMLTYSNEEEVIQY